MECLAVHHVAFEDLGSFATPLRERGYAIRYRHAGADPLTLEEWTRAEMVVVLGGPIGVADMAAYPWLREELAGLAARLDARLPTLGICLGAQLMAKALGGGVSRREAGPEIGWSPLSLPEGDGPLEALRGVPVLHWHGDNIGLPPQALALAATPATPCQAFMAGRHALALQFHAEFAGARLEEWLTGHAVELAQAGIDPGQLREASRRHAPALERAGVAVLRRWLDHLSTT